MYVCIYMCVYTHTHTHTHIHIHTHTHTHIHTPMNKIQNKKPVKTMYWQKTLNKAILHNLRITKLCKIT